jgi:hypothetical protein
MIIKYQDKFESILYAVLYCNLTGYFLVSKNEPENLFNKQDSIDIDNLNWLEILTQHGYKYGEIKWLDDDNNQFLIFKKTIEFILAQNNPEKHNLVVDLIKQAIKFGLSYVNNHALAKKQSKIKIKKQKFNKVFADQKILILDKVN